MKYFFSLFLSIFFFTGLFAQNFYGGAKLGALISQVDGDTHGGYHKISPTGGIYVRNTFARNDRWGMSLELNYRNKGSKHSGTDETDTYRELYKIDLHYLEMPLMFNYRIEKFKIPSLVDYKFKNKLLIEFGPSVSYLLKGDIYLRRLAQNENLNKIEVALNVGITYYFAEHFFANYRFSYTFPFTPVRNFPVVNRFYNRGFYNNCMFFSLGFEF